MNRLFSLMMLALTAVALAGCNTAPVRDPAYAPIRPVVAAPKPEGNGAIYQAGYEQSWFEDMRARRVGDMLTIELVEKTDAKKSATTEVSKSNSNSVTNPTLLGSTPQFNAPGLLPLASNRGNNLGFSLESEHDFSGEGDSEQNNELTGNITVTVIEVLPNGYLVVRGEKRIGINQGNEYVKVSGIVRPADIDATNTVLSTRLADPTIVYVGDGAVADSNVMGWLGRFFISALMPF
ncbi:MAG: flagellar basal body L-ring protein FlgH [Sedimenticola selenatireducens]|uniref:Flagellar L-ring protein n=2 Tax=Sedimenticola selenatireducens TaxID=191960 RepID=A0A2N6CSE5_9GAMM|nr:flagellar basal body L-ring protein FlgH [Sedimenticola selenatireducens]PLX60004.1 MAG: flagellar basal body L-ring protein FlgH [Sedimenticola selenatireducens]